MSVRMSATVYRFGAGGLKPISPEGKNDLPIGTILQLNGYENPRFVIVGNEGISESFPAYGMRYTVVNLETGLKSCKDAYSLEFIAAKDSNRIQTYILDERMSEAEALEYLNKSAMAEQREKEKQQREAEARAALRERLKAENTHLTRIDQAGKISHYALGAKNIRVELKRAFPGVKFSVTSEGYSGGCSIDINWTDGPTSKQVKEITDKYEEGHFDGMEDIYNYDHSNLWPGIFGGAKYVCENRHYSREFVEEIVARFGWEITWNHYGGWDCEDRNHEHHIRRELSETSKVKG